jgi:amino acid adenylation domain-containing protein
MTTAGSRIKLFDRGAREDREYWLGALEGGWDRSAPPADGPPAEGRRSLDHAFSAATRERLAKIAGGSPLLLYTVALAGLAILLHRYGGGRRVVIGSPARRFTEGETPINALPIVQEVDPGAGLKARLGALRSQLSDVYAHQSYPSDRLVRDLGLRASPERFPLFDVALSLEGFHGELAAVGNDLTITLLGAASDLRARLDLRAGVYLEGAGHRFADHLDRLLAAGLADLDRPVGEIDLIDDAEHRLLAEWSGAEAALPGVACIHHLFEQRAVAEPATPALVRDGETVCYGELDGRAERMAAYLAGRGVGRGALVGLCTGRSPRTVVGLLGILKAGAAYLPLDPSYPPERLAFMVEDAGAALVVTEERLRSRLPQDVETVCFDRDAEAIGAVRGARSESGAGPLDLAYVIYTSGSTGRPKGVESMHRGLINLAEAQRRGFGLGPGDRVVQFASLSFDASVWEVVMALTSGACLVLAGEEEVVSPEAFTRRLAEARVSAATLPPSMLAALRPEALPGLRTLVAAGEACTAELAEAWAQGRRFFNAYGPSETTVCASWHECAESEVGAPPIGRPLPNFRLYVVDADGRPVPIGVAGELWIGGAGLARGYRGRPGRTAAAFVPDPFAAPGDPAAAGGRLYRTGDLVRWRADGELSFLGRIDHQVKIRGFRIEPGEIEAALAAMPELSRAVVVADREASGGDRLIAYAVPAAGTEMPSPDELRRRLGRRLPEYMVPSVFCWLDDLPLNPSGKVDRARLPAPERQRPELGVDFVAPRTATESAVAEIWADLLDVERVGVEDSFFDLGGNSLLATRIISRVRAAMEVEVDLPRLLRTPTVTALAALIEERRGSPSATGEADEALTRGGKSIDQHLAELGILPQEELSGTRD